MLDWKVIVVYLPAKLDFITRINFQLYSLGVLAENVPKQFKLSVLIVVYSDIYQYFDNRLTVIIKAKITIHSKQQRVLLRVVTNY